MSTKVESMQLVKSKESSILRRTSIFADSGAEYSPCERYRYFLWRRWDINKPTAVFIMLNPSKATEYVNDPTITRCTGFARRWGMGGLWVLNLFAFRATHSEDMFAEADPVGPENLEAIRTRRDAIGIHIAAWGAHARAQKQGRLVRAMFAERATPLYALQLTAGGNPMHPLYIPSSAEPIIYEPGTSGLEVGSKWVRKYDTVSPNNS